MNLREKVRSGLFWIGGGRLLSQLLTWAITIVVIRLLSPSDYGLLAMATVFMGLLALVAEAGLGPALVQARELDESTLRRSFGAVVIINFTLFAIQFAAAPLVARFFAEDRLVAIVRVLALHFLVQTFTVIPNALLTRRLDFKRASLIGLAAAVCGSLSALGLALHGFGVWTLVFSNLIGLVCQAIGFNLVAPYLRWPKFSLKGMGGLVMVGGQITAARVLYFCYSQADIFIAGRILGKELLGFYSISLHLASLPVQRISAVVNAVAFPAFAEAQQEPETIPGHVLKAIRMLSFFSFPALWGISCVAPELVAVLLGPKWESAVVPLQLLPLVMPVNMLSPFLNTAFQGIGRFGVVLRNALTAAIILPVAFWIGTHWGLVGLCIAWLIAFPLVFLLNLRRMLPLIGLNVSDVLSAAAPPALAALGMYASVAGARHLVGSSLSAPLIMAVLITTGAASYTLITIATNWKGVREVLNLLRKGP